MILSEYLYDHYRDTCTRQDAALKDRNRFFAATAGCACLLAAYAYSPEAATGLADMWLSRFGIDLVVSGRVVQTAIWLATLYFYVRYLQANTTVERTYLYESSIEAKLRAEGEHIAREGGDYCDECPPLSKFIDCLYKYVFVVALPLACIVKIGGEIPAFSLVTLVDTACCAIIVALSVLDLMYMRKVNARYVETVEEKAGGEEIDDPPPDGMRIDLLHTA